MSAPSSSLPSSGTSPPLAWSPWAGVSLALGIIAVLLFCIDEALGGFSFLLMSIPAIFFGHLAKGHIEHSPRPMRGYEMARVGLWLGYLTTFMTPILALGMYSGGVVSKKAEMSIAINNCRQVIIALRLYSPDHDGMYPDATLPDAKNSNEVFRRLFVEEVCSEESIFGSAFSDVGKPDGKIGKPPDYLEAVKPGENHWAMVVGLSDSSPSSYPLVFECPSDFSWPPKWNAIPSRPIGSTKPGRSWSGGKVIVGMNDGSVTSHKLAAPEGQNLELGPVSRDDPTGKNAFTQNEEPHRILPPVQK